jgi:glycerophosphoryl diester phosphodiesterase
MNDVSWLKTSFFAHRGFHDIKHQVVENSVLAFEQAIAHEYGIELDVRMTKDQQIVVFHDTSLKRLCGVDVLVEATNLASLKTYSYLASEANIPTLQEVLNVIDGKVPLLIELKTKKNAKKISRNVQNLLENYKGLYAIQSYDPRVLLWYKQNAPRVLRGQIAQRNRRKEKNAFVRFLTNHMFLNVYTKPDFINYRISDLPRKQLDVLKQKGLPILSFTAKSQKDFDFVKKHYDNAMFEGFHPKR